MFDSWETIAVIHAAQRNLKATVDEAQAIVDQQGRALDRSQRRVRSLEAEVAALRRERTARGMRILAAAAVRNVH